LLQLPFLVEMITDGAYLCDLIAVKAVAKVAGIF
jgi:hypothetical protein